MAAATEAMLVAKRTMMALKQAAEQAATEAQAAYDAIAEDEHDEELWDALEQDLDEAGTYDTAVDEIEEALSTLASLHEELQAA